MPNAHYLAGRRAEWKVRDTLQAEGYNVIRAAASIGLFDLVAFSIEGSPTHKVEGAHVLAIQVKQGGRPSPGTWKGCIEQPVPAGVIKMLVWYPPAGQAVRVLYCASADGDRPLPEFCWRVGWHLGLPPKQEALRLR
jgi:hypothetical protein